VEWADLAILDLSKADTPEGRTQLSVEVREALSSAGFFYVVNHGYTPEQVRLDSSYDFLKVKLNIKDGAHIRYRQYSF